MRKRGIQRTLGLRADDAVRAEADTEQEIAFHLDMRATELRASGMSEDAARAQAESEFGDARSRVRLARAEKSVRTRRNRIRWIEDLVLDVRYTVRGLRNNVLFAIVALMTLGLGIGSTIAIFTLVNAYLLRPMPFPAPDRLVVLNDFQPNYGKAPASFPEYTDWHEQASSFDLIAGIFRRTLTYTGGEFPERLRVSLVTRDYFPLVGAQPLLGRLFVPDEHRTGAPLSIVLAENFWRDHLSSDPSVIGRTIRFGDSPYVVVGVARSFPDLATGDPTVAYAPMEPKPLSLDRGTHYMNVWGRLKPGITPEQGLRDLELVAQRSNAQSGNDHGVRMAPMRDLLVGESGTMLIVMLAIAACVLLIAALNVANLLVARAASREQEFAVRSALGAGRSRLVRQLFIEGLVLAGAGFSLGLPLAWYGSRLLLNTLPPNIPRPASVGFDARVWIVSIAVVAGTALMFAVAPVLLQLRRRMADVLRSARGAAAAEANSMRRAVIVAEIALSMALLVCAALVTRSFVRLSHVDLGYEPRDLVTFGINLPRDAYANETRIAEFRAQLQRSLRGIPGVQSTTLASNMPTAPGMNGDVAVLETADPTEPVAGVEKRWVTPEYLSTLGIRLVDGRFFSDADRANSEAVAVISKSLANKLWPGGSAIGKHINAAEDDGKWETVIGVVSDVRSWGLDQLPPMEVLMPIAQGSAEPGFAVAVRLSGDPEKVPASIRSAVRSLDTQVPVQNIRMVDDLLSESVAGRRLLLLLAIGFGAVALVLAAVGTAGLVAYGVARRTREIGLRLALGADPSSVLQLLMSEGLLLSIFGMVFGIIVAAANAHLLRTQLFEIDVTDPVAYGASIAVLTLATLLATYLPARRATRISPVSAMRGE